ncbi:hypothetical protein GLYMA_17G127075v4 [Glycine max]|nr:hypothetical protein GLYMA_17G127075v4 [Glycine max]KAH1118205.1 hypothetical protein GYH30_047104 [Glycine max]
MVVSFVMSMAMWLLGFSGNSGFMTNTNAELLAIQNRKASSR